MICKLRHHNFFLSIFPKSLHWMIIEIAKCCCLELTLTKKSSKRSIPMYYILHLDAYLSKNVAKGGIQKLCGYFLVHVALDQPPNIKLLLWSNTILFRAKKNDEWKKNLTKKIIEIEKSNPPKNSRWWAYQTHKVL